MAGRHVGVVAAVLVAGIVSAAARQTQKAAGVDQLGWLAGCWTSDAGGRHIEEHWMQPRGGAMLGMSRTVAGERTVDFEYMLIRSSGTDVLFVAKPSNQPEATFTMVHSAEGGIRFENPQHDFPQRILYRLNPDGSLLARIEGTQKGQIRGVDFPMHRGGC